VYFILAADGQTPVHCDLMTWAEAMERPDWRIVRQVHYRRARETWFISTVFLGLDHNFMERGAPVLWETMVFAPDGESVFMDRYASYAGALAGHTATFELVRRGLLAEEWLRLKRWSAALQRSAAQRVLGSKSDERRDEDEKHAAGAEKLSIGPLPKLLT
jgi:hypothetical protein